MIEVIVVGHGLRDELQLMRIISKLVDRHDHIVVLDDSDSSGDIADLVHLGKFLPYMEAP